MKVWSSSISMWRGSPLCDAFRRRIALRHAYRIRKHRGAAAHGQRVTGGVPDRATQLAFERNYRVPRDKNIMLIPPTPATQGSTMTFRNGLDSLLRPEDSVLVLIDHQPYQLTNLNSHDPQMVVNNSTALAKAAKAFGVPTILTLSLIHI